MNMSKTTRRLAWLAALALPAFAAVLATQGTQSPETRPAPAPSAAAAGPVSSTLGIAEPTTRMAGATSTAAAQPGPPGRTTGSAAPTGSILASAASATCSGFTRDEATMAALAVVPLLPETGTLGRPVLRRTRVDYAAPGNGVTVLRATGVCPSATPGRGDPALCGLDRGATITPKPGAALTHWGTRFSAEALTLTVKRASDLAAGRAGLTWRSGTQRSGFVGFCAGSADPIVEIRASGRGIALTQPRHGFDPFGRAVDLGRNPSPERQALAATVAYERGVYRLHVAERTRFPLATLAARYAPLLGLPLDVDYETLMAAVLRSGRYAEAFAIDLEAARAALRAETARAVAALRQERDASYARIGYTPHRIDRVETLTRGQNPLKGVHSKVIASVNTLAGTEFVATQHLSLDVISVPNPMEEIGEPASFCAGGGTCNFPLPYDLKPRQMWLIWRSTTLSAQQIADIVTGNGYRIELRINGKQLPIGPPVGYDVEPPAGQGAWAYQFTTPGACKPGETCFVTTILANGQFQNGGDVSDEAMPWDIRLKVYKLTTVPLQIIGIDANGNPIYAQQQQDLFASVGLNLLAGAWAHLSYFQEAIYPTYAHDRCSHCHSFQVPSDLAAHHGMYESSISLAPSDFVPNAHVMKCFNCHDYLLHEERDKRPQLTEVRWRVPFIDLDVDWSSKTPAQICGRTTTNLPTIALRRKHFHEDARLAWALENGFLPTGSTPLPTAPPHDFDEFLLRMDAWSEHGTPCGNF